ncbi:metallophosphoesterase [Anabaena sp. FACHB-1237]|uniref:metallophosphoesterase family protein n=1 Tax=Anabaena sp. FACHB-1237 TaxID=2692769 RepID=UPI001681B1A4|nr:metallophosphoesterase [Anabaena sp. FACHB-1237]MBD2138897.1 metallophosphoesterase [Anabaena sp. FACHB-1237]
MREIRKRRIVIGDVHGHYDGLMLLLKEIALTSDDQVYFLGDLIDRGPKSSEVVNFVQENNYSCLLGNHEQMLLNVITNKNSTSADMQAWLYSGGQATITSYKSPNIPQKHLDWFANLPAYLDLGDVWLSHAGVDPSLTVDQQTTEELCWIRDKFHRMKKPYFPDKWIITGHTITFTLPGVIPGMLAQGQGWIDIDTGAYHIRSGWLTGLDITNHLIYQANVFSYKTRILTWDEGVKTVHPEDFMTSRRSR